METGFELDHFIVISGTELADTLIGTISREAIYGYGGNDRITAGPSDTLNGSIHDRDLVYAGDGNDNVKGGLGDDTLFGEKGNDWLYGEGGNDDLFGGVGSDRLIGGEGDDYYEGGDGNDYLIDTELSWTSASSNDYMDGGLGNDDLRGGNDSDTLIGGLGNDTLNAGSDVRWHNDNTPGYNLLDGGLGNDVLIAGNSYDTLIGGDGDDTLREHSWGDDAPYEAHHYGGPGDDDIILRGGRDYIEPGSGDNSVYLAAYREHNHGVKEIVLDPFSTNRIEFANPEYQFAEIRHFDGDDQIVVPRGWTISFTPDSFGDIITATNSRGESYDIAYLEFAVVV